MGEKLVDRLIECKPDDEISGWFWFAKTEGSQNCSHLIHRVDPQHYPGPLFIPELPSLLPCIAQSSDEDWIGESNPPR
ncbi:hypothetical protein CRG98_005419 [Punica granatum]|uniref:Uncharacterized protein n=1 Tax=Punica granatum TaxID=22663 RepID=A0A2I0L0C1_PUNGR|nr:hypothetical protein CRG98_005419 [Punica granatum]